MHMTNTQMYYCKLNKDGGLTSYIPFLGSVYKKTFRAPQEKGVCISQSIIIRTAEITLFPITGDMVSFKEPTTDSISELSLKKSGAVTIKAVNDNRRGCSPHFKMEVT